MARKNPETDVTGSDEAAAQDKDLAQPEVPMEEPIEEITEGTEESPAEIDADPEVTKAKLQYPDAKVYRHYSGALVVDGQ